VRARLLLRRRACRGLSRARALELLLQRGQPLCGRQQGRVQATAVRGRRRRRHGRGGGAAFFLARLPARPDCGGVQQGRARGARGRGAAAVARVAAASAKRIARRRRVVLDGRSRQRHAQQLAGGLHAAGRGGAAVKDRDFDRGSRKHHPHTQKEARGS
jgi:hypothetical protein